MFLYINAYMNTGRQKLFGKTFLNGYFVL